MPRRAAGIAVIVLVCASQPGCPEEEESTRLPMEAVYGEGGVAVTFPAPLPEGVGRIQAEDADGTLREVELTGGGLVVDPDGGPGSRYGLDHPGYPHDPVEAVGLEQWTSYLGWPVLHAAGSASVELGFEPGEANLTEGDVIVRRRALPDGAASYWAYDAGDGSPGWVDPPTALAEEVRASSLVEQAFSVYGVEAGLPLPATAELGVLLRIVDPVTGREVLAGAPARVPVASSALRWGDPHAHTNLSHDGCEDIAAGCADRGALPGADHFANAVAAGLDFAAITDHAEWDAIEYDGGDVVPIWATTQQHVADAEAAHGPDFIPLLGFEWTHFTPVFAVVEPGEDPDPYAAEFTAGHKTVLLDGTSACDAYRVAAPRAHESYVKGDTGMEYVNLGVHPEADKAPLLFERLDQAGAECGTQSAVTFFHHTAMLLPNPVNWSLPPNAPDGHYEALVEIASEHGSSECRDLLDEGCDFAPAGGLNNFQVDWGSVQEALSQGYRLGFVGGTDSHDARPGSLDDGPSWLALYQDLDGDGVTEGPLEQEYDGAITGVWIDGAWSRSSLFEALRARRTLASTGPRGAVAALAIGADGTPYLPGEGVPEAAFPLQVVARLDLDGGWDVDRFELVEPDGGTVLGFAAGATFDHEIEDPGSPALYLRVRAHADGAEHRVWISPWFVERDE